MKIRAMIIMLAVAICCVSASAQSNTKPQAINSTASATAPLPVAVVDPADQLAVVRLTAQMQELVTQIKPLQDKLKELNQKQYEMVETIKKKLPAPPKGKLWEAKPDGQFGVTFELADIPAPPPAKP